MSGKVPKSKLKFSTHPVENYFCPVENYLCSVENLSLDFGTLPIGIFSSENVGGQFASEVRIFHQRQYNVCITQATTKIYIQLLL